MNYEIVSGNNFNMPNDIFIEHQPNHPTFDIHSHSFIEIVYVISGKIEHILNEKKTILSTGDFALIDLGSSHGLIKIDEINCQLINCIFRPSFIDLSLSDDSNLKEIFSCRELQFHQNIPDELFANCVFHDDTGEIKKLISKMYTEFFLADFGYLKVLKFTLLSILTHVMRHLLAISVATDNTSMITLATDYIEKNYYNKISLDEISALLHYNPRYFCTKFKQETGYSFSEYLQRTRIAHSCYFLQYTNMKITDIASFVGYSDIRYFEKLFKKFINRSPSEHRNSYKTTDTFQ